MDGARWLISMLRYNAHQENSRIKTRLEESMSSRYRKINFGEERASIAAPVAD